MELINIQITYGSKYCVALLRDEVDSEKDAFEIRGYSLNSFNEKWRKRIEGTYIKMKEIEQTDDGNILAICYQDDGEFKVVILQSDGIGLDEVQVTKILHLDRRSKPIEGFWEPLITCAFVPVSA